MYYCNLRPALHNFPKVSCCFVQPAHDNKPENLEEIKHIKFDSEEESCLQRALKKGEAVPKVISPDDMTEEELNAEIKRLKKLKEAKACSAARNVEKVEVPVRVYSFTVVYWHLPYYKPL